ncbi:hypothetical protein AB5J62_09560 [Amycolatopsis sp. cg5]|uniref:hypothetical protein n=1 Tax=Amycolatopsis sp. cg5 TaxID=3238802 RepID=UPI003524F3CB
MSRRSIAGVAVALLLACLPGAAGATVEKWPSPLDFASQLDLECFKTDAYQPPATVVTLRHLNPVLAGQPAETVKVGAREQLCVPVAKNGKIPPPVVVDLVQFVDLSCYQVRSIGVESKLKLTHLNPVVTAMGVPSTEVMVGGTDQLCLPVVKNGKFPPDWVRQFVQYLDLKCSVIFPAAPLGIQLTLSHLNPVLANLPKQQVKVNEARRLCVPVQKNDQKIPSDILDVIQWVDLEKFDVTPGPTPGPIALTLDLTHLNPLMSAWPRERAVLGGPTQLGLPVAKNGKIPPG